jgi:uncharacterized damage-inducible protein DinB
MTRLTSVHDVPPRVQSDQAPFRVTEYLLDELGREAERTRVVLQKVPTGHYDWRPHEKSMAFGYLAHMVALIPTWIARQIEHDDLDIAPVGGASTLGDPGQTSAALLAKLDASVASARTAFAGTSDEHLRTAWQLKRRGEVVQEAPRYLMIQDTFNHWAHHRGQMTVYLRLLGATVPATYGPSADDTTFR